MSDGGRIWVLLGTALALFGGGYCLGLGKAEAEGEARVSALKVEREEERRQASESYGRALADALEQYEKEARRAQAVSAALEKNKQAHAKEAEALRRRISDAVRGSSHTFSPDFVRLYNEAIGLSGDTLQEALGAFFAASGAGESGTSGSRVLEPFSGVSEADILAHIARYGGRCRGLEAQLAGWQELQRSWK